VRIAYIYEYDAADPGVQSTRPFSIRQELKRRFDVFDIFPVANVSKKLFAHKKIWYRARGQRHHLDREWLSLKEYGWRVGRLLKSEKPDLVFSPSSMIPTFLESDAPIVYCTDAPFGALVNYYDSFSCLSDLYVRQVLRQEREAHSNAARIVYPSSWALNEAVRIYGADRAKLIEQPFGANLPYETSWLEIKDALDERCRRRHISIVLISSDWVRKGGQFAMAVKENLRARGVEASLRVIGTVPTPKPESVEFLGKINKWTDEGARRFRSVLSTSDFIISPSLAEAYGMALWEGAAHGLPMIARATGGMASIVRDGETGLLFSDDSEAANVADWIIKVRSGNEYREIAGRAFEDYQRRGNWRAFVDRVFAP
jgi:glycosyltransferase involved in cell wall biosynthesis